MVSITGLDTRVAGMVGALEIFGGPLLKGVNRAILLCELYGKAEVWVSSFLAIPSWLASNTGQETSTKCVS